MEAGGSKKDAEAPPGYLEAVGKLLGLLAGLATVVYLAGALVLALRFGFEDLPWDAVISSVPREFSISVGITALVAPLVVASIVYIAYRLASKENVDPPGSENLASWSVGFGFALALPGALIELLKEGEIKLSMLGWFVIAWLVAAVWSYVILSLRSAVVSRYGEEVAPGAGRVWNAPRTVAVMCGVYALMLLPAGVVIGATLPMTDVKACGVGGAEIEGVFVGDTESRLYVGLKPDESEDTSAFAADGRIVSLPYDKLSEVYIGEKSSDESCLSDLDKPE